MRIHLVDRKIEFIADLKDFRWALGAGVSYRSASLPMAQPIFTRDIGTQEIYALR